MRYTRTDPTLEYGKSDIKVTAVPGEMWGQDVDYERNCLSELRLRAPRIRRKGAVT